MDVSVKRIFIGYILFIVLFVWMFAWICTRETPKESIQEPPVDFHPPPPIPTPNSDGAASRTIESMIEFMLKASDNEVVGNGRNQMLVSHVSPLAMALNEHLISLDSTRSLLLYRNGPFAIASRDEILVDDKDQIFARVFPLHSNTTVDELRLWVEKRKEIKDESDLPRGSSGGVGGGNSHEAMDCIIFLYSTKLKLSGLQQFVRALYEKDLQRKNDQLGNQLFYFKEVGSAMMAAEQQNIRSLANEQIKSQMISASAAGGALGSSSADRVASGLRLQSMGSSMLNQHLTGHAYASGGSGGSGMGGHRPFLFMMTPFQTNKRMENLAGAIFRTIEKRIRDFTQNKDWWIKRGQPHTYGLLVKGPPGCGKTSLTKAIAKSTNRNIFDLSIHAGVTQRQMFDFFHEDVIFVQPRFTGMILDGNNRGQDSTYRIPMSRRLLVFDDFTAGTNIFEDRESVAAMLSKSYSGNSFQNSITNGNDPVTLQFMLNLYDGVLENKDRISIFCDNYDNIDRAFIRPGRIDDVVELGYLTYEGMIDFMVMFMEIQDVQVLHDLFNSYKEYGTPFEAKVLTSAELNRILMTHREEKLEKVVHAVVGESIRFKEHYDSSGDTYYRRTREQQDMNELFPPMDRDEDEEENGNRDEGNKEEEEERQPVKPSEPLEEKVDVEVEVEEKPEVVKVADTKELRNKQRKEERRRIHAENQARLEEERKRKEEQEAQRKQKFMEEEAQLQRQKDEAFNQLVNVLNADHKGVSSLFAQRKTPVVAVDSLKDVSAASAD